MEVTLAARETRVSDRASMWLELCSCPHAIRFIRAAGARTRFLEAGVGNPETLLFLHGSGGYLEAYLRNVAAHASKYHVIAMDMLGHGYTDKPDHPYEPHHYVRHILDFLDALHVENVHLSGESLGGWVAARLASEHPGRVRSLVLNTAAGVHFDPQVSERIHRLSMATVDSLSHETVRKRLEFLMLDPNMVTDEMVEMRLRVYSQPDFRRAMENIMCLHTAQYRIPNLLTIDQLAAIEAPTLVLWTTHDPGSTMEVGRQLARGIPGAKFVVMENCGHWPQFEDPDTFNATQLKFLSGGSP